MTDTAKVTNIREDFEYWIFDTGDGFEVLTENHECFTRKPAARLIVAKGTGRRELHQFATAILDHLQCHGFNGEGPECFESFSPTKAEHATGCAVCDPDAHPPKSRDEIMAEIEAKLEGQLKIAHQGSGWALIAMTAFWEDDPGDTPVVLYGNLQSREAAEAAMQNAVASYLDEVVQHPLRYDLPGDEPVGFFNAVGRILGALRDLEKRFDDPRPNDYLLDAAFDAYWASKDCQNAISPYQYGNRSISDAELPF